MKNEIEASEYSAALSGHEHLPEFGLIDMNGRMYDPLLGRFLSPDPYVQMPDFSQNFNRYSYCINNPLKYTDPSGEVFGVDDAIVMLAMAYFGGMQANFFTADNPFNPGDWNWKSSSTYIGIGSGAMSGLNMTGSLGTFMQTSGAISNGILQAGIQVGVNGVGNLIDDDPALPDMPRAGGWLVQICNLHLLTQDL